MQLDFNHAVETSPARQNRGKRAHLSGMAAEDAVCRRYQAEGYELVARRKRCPDAEIDLLFRRAGQLIAVEVKASATHDLAQEHATAAQLTRVAMACERCMLDMAVDGISDMRLDLALVDGQGHVVVLEAFPYF